MISIHRIDMDEFLLDAFVIMPKSLAGGNIKQGFETAQVYQLCISMTE